jgi:hypothetical protein
MTDAELFDALDGLFAFDLGCGSGIHDELLRKRVQDELELDRMATPYSLVGPRLTAFSRRLLDPPYTLEDMASFIRWLDERMKISL